MKAGTAAFMLKVKTMAKDELLEYVEKLEHELYKFRSCFNGRYGTVSGYFASYAMKADSYGHVCKRGFLNNGIRNSGRPILLLCEHDYFQIIGIVTRIEEREAGVYMTADFLNTPRAQEIRKLALMGALSKMSFAYYRYDSGKITLPDGTEADEIRECELLEISITDNPAQPLSVITKIT